MSQLGSYDMSFPGLSTSGGQSSGTSSSTGSGSSSQSTQMIPGMQGVYSQLLGMNATNYGNVMNAYQGQKASNAAQLPGVYAGYGQVQGDVMNTLGMGQVLGQNGNWGVADPAAQAIGRTYQQQTAGNRQQMASAGLGNTTIGAGLDSQAAQNAALSYGQLGSQLAGQAAGYESQIGQAGLAAQMQGLGMQTGLTQGALNPLATQFGNTAGSLTGGVGQSSYNQASQSKQQSEQGSGGSSGSSGGGASSGLPAGTPGGPAGAYTGGGGAGSGGGGGGSSGGLPASGSSSGPAYNPSGAYNSTGGSPNNAYGPTGPNNTNTGANTPLSDAAGNAFPEGDQAMLRNELAMNNANGSTTSVIGYDDLNGYQFKITTKDGQSYQYFQKKSDLQQKMTNAGNGGSTTVPPIAAGGDY